jgi:hypothetical protein
LPSMIMELAGIGEPFVIEKNTEWSEWCPSKVLTGPENFASRININGLLRI